MITHAAPVIGILFLTKVISYDEAYKLQTKLPGEALPKTWVQFIIQVEDIIGRKLTESV